MKFSKHFFHLKGKKAENIVHELALKTFLTDWCYLNPKLPDGKELCDLLVVFENIAIIWAIKDLKLDAQGQYKRAEVEKNLRQLSGARRQLFDLKTRVELQNPRRGKESFDPKITIISEVYLISVLLGEGEEIFPGVENVKNYTAHVFTKDSTQIILNELDTISDFCKYLRDKEAFFKEGKGLTISGGEEELLAWYIWHGRSFKDFDKADFILITEGIWERVQNEPAYKAKRTEDRISYFWDSIIDKVHDRLYGNVSDYEKVARELARPSRFERRCLSKAFLNAAVRAHNDISAPIFRRMMQSNGVTYCFLFLNDPEPRKHRQAMLSATCYIARGQFPENKKVIGIATEKKEPGHSYDFCLFETENWTQKDQKKSEELQRETGIFTNPIVTPFHEDEYPKLKKNLDEKLR